MIHPDLTGTSLTHASSTSTTLTTGTGVLSSSTIGNIWLNPDIDISFHSPLYMGKPIYYTHAYPMVYEDCYPSYIDNKLLLCLI